MELIAKVFELEDKELLETESEFDVTDNKLLNPAKVDELDDIDELDTDRVFDATDAAFEFDDT